MKTASAFILVLPVLAAFACGKGDEPPFDLEVHATALPIAGANLHVALEEADGDVLIANEWFPVDDGSLDVAYGDVLAKGTAYRVHLFYDMNDDNTCDAPPSDRVWNIDVGPVADTVTIDLGALEQDTKGCDAFETR